MGVTKMKIIPLSELRNTAEISRMAIEESPVFVTKQGTAHLVIMSHEHFEEMERKIKGQSSQ
jgi:PHD/YefM family antitoxin component YafN of YafNO toxin-antitoxin module